MNKNTGGAVFKDRTEAGRALADHLADHFASGLPEETLVVGLTGGGVAVAAEVATRLELPMDVVVVQRLHRSGQPTMVLGSVAEHGTSAMVPGAWDRYLVGPNELEDLIRRQRLRLRRRTDQIRRGIAPLSCRGRTVLLITDGLASGASARAAGAAVRARGAQHIFLAVPVSSPAGPAAVALAADEFSSLYSPEPFRSVGEWYADFSEVTDEQVSAVLHGTSGFAGPPSLVSSPPSFSTGSASPWATMF
ncbi:phosphoribosyltransferase family protein [Kineosporia sp. NBRC 101731]|uniref:phosphoribosyltransferase family protein n=1 Tax=Kineosporia sp. NBRC 101731 TaxID=3032199 RepID=UPI0024A11E89|nr:phosphoribosyltransferase family protein [Kineosporia sp. NBRC 101731]GLY32166.1 phosphoribosyltransferase [Kineosporia sp. NBRC 101731]